MPNHIVKDNLVLFRQSYPLHILTRLFVNIYTLGIVIYDTNNKLYPHSVIMSESDFLSMIELSGE